MPEDSPEGKLPLLQRFAFGTGHMLNVVAVAGMWFPYGIAFFKQVLLIPHASVGHIFIIAQVAGAVFMPFVGMWSDQCVCKYGRRKIFHLVGLIAFVCSFFFVWHESASAVQECLTATRFCTIQALRLCSSLAGQPRKLPNWLWYRN